MSDVPFITLSMPECGWVLHGSRTHTRWMRMVGRRTVLMWRTMDLCCSLHSANTHNTLSQRALFVLSLALEFWLYIFISAARAVAGVIYVSERCGQTTQSTLQTNDLSSSAFFSYANNIYDESMHY